MNRRERLKAAWTAKGYTTARAVAAALNMNETTFSDIVRGKTKQVDDTVKDAIAKLLGIKSGTLWLGSDDDFALALAGVDADAVAGQGGGIHRTIRLDSAIVADGLVSGRITYNALKEPTGKGARIIYPHNWRGNPEEEARIRSVDLPCISPDLEVVEVQTRLELPDKSDVLPVGYLLIVDPSLKAPVDGRLVLAKRDLPDPFADIPDDAPEDVGLAQVRIFQYHPERGHDLLWPLAGGPVADLKDGWEIIGTVIWWRPPP